MNRFTNKGKKAQAAIDFLISYGIALTVLGITLIVIYKLGFFNFLLTPVSCIPTQAFACGIFYINSNGMLTVTLSQATGGTITVNGFACSSNINATADRPQYGNIFVTSNPNYYPSGTAPSNGINFYSDTSNTFRVLCYSPSGLAVGTLGGIFYGHVWMNYTVTGYGTVTQSIASITTKYV